MATALDRFLHYDHVGSVTMKSDGDGEMIIAEKQYQDAFGNRRQSGADGRWDGDASGWSHNTKERDEDIGIIYMYQRWYQPETGTFLSRAPYRPMIEHQYGFAENNPLMMVDPDGMCPWGTRTECLLQAANRWQNEKNKIEQIFNGDRIENTATAIVGISIMVTGVAMISTGGGSFAGVGVFMGGYAVYAGGVIGHYGDFNT